MVVFLDAFMHPQDVEGNVDAPSAQFQDGSDVGFKGISGLSE